MVSLEGDVDIYSPVPAPPRRQKLHQ